MPKSRTRKRKVSERPARKRSWWSRNWRSVDSGVTYGCLPAVACILVFPLVIML